MNRNTSVQLLKLLSSEEIRRLGKFLRSPYFNYSQPVIALFERLRRHHPDYDPQKIQPVNLWKKIHPTAAYEEQKYWKLNFKLCRLIERFMAVEEMEANHFEHKKHLLYSHRRRNAQTLFVRETKSLIAQIESQPYQDIHSYSKTLWLKHDYFYSTVTDKYSPAIYSVEDAMHDLDRFYTLAKLRFASEIKNREQIFAQKTPLKLLGECITTCHEYEHENPAYLMYRTILSLYDNEASEEAFYRGKEQLAFHFASLSKNDQNEILLNLRNYAIRQLNKGHNSFWKELLDLYQLGLELNLIVDNNKISDAAFGNIVKTGCVAKEFAWTEEFIESHEQFLDEEIRVDTKILSMGILYFEKEEFHKVIELYSQHAFSQLLHQMSARITLIKSWFSQFQEDKNLYSVLSAKLESAEKFFRRNKAISKQKKQMHLNFILATRQLSDLLYQRKSAKLIRQKMNKYLSLKSNMATKQWFLNKLDQI
ncbi:MAG: hypothetical protein AAFZ15_11220 [Bacteroidota bacterium]